MITTRRAPTANRCLGVFRPRKVIAGAIFCLCLVLGVMQSQNAVAKTQATNASVNTQSIQTNAGPEFGVGAWIWTSETHDQQFCRFWRQFEIPPEAKVISARIRLAVDDCYSLFIDGREIGRGSGWHQLTEYDLTLLLEPGLHTVAVEGFNAFKQAGFVGGLRVRLGDGETIEIVSDSSWKIVPNNISRWERKTRENPNWPSAKVVSNLGSEPWPAKPIILKAPQTYPVILQFWQAGWFQIVLLSLCSVVGLVCVWLVGKLALHSRVQLVVQRERARIARDIHDDLSAGLTQLVLIGEVVQSTLPTESESRQQAGVGCEKARGLVQSMHDVIWAIDSQHDSIHDFSSHVCRFAESFLEPTSIRCHFDIDEEMPDFPFDLGRRRNLFLAVKEALHNTVRHSGASELLLRIRRRANWIEVVIEDNGKGFDPALIDRERNGLTNMQKRAADAGGVCNVSSEAGGGCRVVLTVPLEHSAGGPTEWWRRLVERVKGSKNRRSYASPVAVPKTLP